MHRCVAIPEIRSRICRCLNKKSTLFFLSLTCRAFKDPALDQLWRRLDSFRPLVQCLPRDAWKDEGNKILNFVRPLVPSDVQLIEKYLPRVHTLIFNSLQVKIAVLETFSFVFQGPLFRNLKELAWVTYNDITFPYLRLFLGASLTTLEIELQTVNMTYCTVINNLHRLLRPSYIRSLVFSIRNLEERRPVECINACLDKWVELQELSIPGLTQDGLLHIAKLPHLRSLSLGRCLDKMGSGLLDTITSPFPSLTSATLWGPPQVHIPFIPYLGFAKVEDLTIGTEDFSETTTRSLWRSCMKSINEHCDPNSLKKIRLNFPHIECRYLDFSDMIEPLFPFRHLMEVRMELEGHIHISVDNAIRMAKAWPKLILLQISKTDYMSCATTPVTVLTHLANGCLHLHRLVLEVDAAKKEIREELLRIMDESDFGQSNPSLKYLDVGQSPISHKELVATFLSNIFPNITSIRSTHLDETDEDIQNHKRWQRIGQVLLPLLRMTKRRAQASTSNGGSEEFENGAVSSDERLRSCWVRTSGTDHWSDGELTDDHYVEVTEDEDSD